MCAQIIEKRRRDRINNSLSELRRLVPSAFEKQVRQGHLYIKVIVSTVRLSCPSVSLLICKEICEIKRLLSFFSLQGSAKLEKAEILQMTVDHLKMLHAAGGKGSKLLSILTYCKAIVNCDYYTPSESYHNVYISCNFSMFLFRKVHVIRPFLKLL